MGLSGPLQPYSVSFDRLYRGIDNFSKSLKDKSEVNRIIVKKQPCQLLNTSREFFPSFRGSNFYKFDDYSS